MKNLLIVESPYKVGILKEILSNIKDRGTDWDVVATYGHIEDLEGDVLYRGGEPEEIRVAFTVKKWDVLGGLVESSRKYDCIYIATDPDREGEGIAWTLWKYLPGEKRRVKFSSITRESVESGLGNAGEIDLNLVKAQQTRKVVDWLIGYTLSGKFARYMKDKHGYEGALSIGRVQAPAVQMVILRDDLAEKVGRKLFWGINAEISLGFFAGYMINANHPKLYSSRHKAISVIGKCGHIFKLKSLKTSGTKIIPPEPFRTVTLCKEATARLGYSVEKTMKVAQKLYEKGYCTYIRTDSVHISEEGEKLARIILEEMKKKMVARRFLGVFRSGVESHECIRPSVYPIPWKKLAGDEVRLLKLIFDRFVASQMEEAELMKREAEFENNGVLFRGVTRFPRKLGFLEVWKYGFDFDDGEVIGFSMMREGESYLGHCSLKKQVIKVKGHTEGTLLGDMETYGIGRPSTYSTVFRTIKERGYIQACNDGVLKSTEVGREMVRFLDGGEERKFLLDFDYTKKLEDKLDLIAEGKLDPGMVIAEVMEKLKVNRVICGNFAGSGTLVYVSDKKQERLIERKECNTFGLGNKVSRGNWLYL